VVDAGTAEEGLIKPVKVMVNETLAPTATLLNNKTNISEDTTGVPKVASEDVA